VAPLFIRLSKILYATAKGDSAASNHYWALLDTIALEDDDSWVIIKTMDYMGNNMNHEQTWEIINTMIKHG
jgi:hypothetical protein